MRALQEATLATYHPQLVFCVTQYLSKDAALLGPVVQEVVNAFPVARMANSPKVRTVPSGRLPACFGGRPLLVILVNCA